MLYAKVNLETREILEFPISVKEVKRRLQQMNISTQNDIRGADLTHLGYYGVPPDNNQPWVEPGYRAVVGDPIWQDDRLVRQWIIIPADKDFEDRLWVRIRERRAVLLKQSDWTELPSVQAIRSDKWREEWSIYRQQLRDITNVRHPTHATFPRSPNETER